VKGLKKIGLAAVLALALMAVIGVASASAGQFIAPGVGAGGVTKFNGSRSGKNHSVRLGESDWTNCSEVSFSGEMKGEHASTIMVTPSLSGCSWFGLPASWAINGCKYRLRPGSDSGKETTGLIDIAGCEKPMTFNVSGCKLEIGNQGSVGTVKYITTEVEKRKAISVVASLEHLTYTRTNAGGCVGGNGTFSDGQYFGEWTIKGTNTKGESLSIEVEGTTGPPVSFAAEEAPVTVSGIDTRPGSFFYKRISELGGNGMTCEKYSLSGTSSSVSAETLSLVPKYQNCKLNGEAVPDSSVSAGGCSYVLHANGKFDIAGATCASNPMTLSRTGCVTTIGPQSGLSGLTYQNEGYGPFRKVLIPTTVVINTVTFTNVGAGCATEGTHSVGHIEATATLSATNSLGAGQGLAVE
jgi:hypothetical protein